MVGAGVSAGTAQTVDWVVQKNGGWADRVANPHAMAVAADGRIAVTGSADSGGTLDFLTVVYGQDGQVQWSAPRDSGPGRTDHARAIAWGTDGRVFVSGDVLVNQGDVLTVAYDAAGNELWERWIDGGSPGIDLVRDLAVSADGLRVHVLVVSPRGSESGVLLATYSAAGDKLWARRGPSLGTGEEPVVLFARADGSVVVVGSARNGQGTTDVIALAFDVAGAPLWTTVESAHPASLSIRALAPETDGGFAVAGTSAADGELDLLLVKFGAAGSVTWARTHGAAQTSEEATAVAIDGSGRYFVTGWTATGNAADFLTVAWDATGDELWARTRAGIPDLDERPVSAVVLASGAVAITGSTGPALPQMPPRSLLTVAYAAASGNEVWERVDQPVPTAVVTAVASRGDSSGLYVLASALDDSDLDFMLAACDGSGNDRWVVAEPALPTNEVTGQESSVVVPDGEVVLLADTLGGGDAEDFLLTAVDAGGVEIWSRQYDSGLGLRNSGRSVVTGSLGELVVGGFASNGDDLDFEVVVHDDAGQLLWSRTRGSEPGFDDFVSRVVVDATGNIYAVGTTVTDAGYEGKVVAYDAAGNELWLWSSGSGATSVILTSAVVTSDGNLVVGSADQLGGSDLSLAMLAPDGAELWRIQTESPIIDLAATESGTFTAVMTAYLPSEGQSEFRTAKYSPAGFQIWERTRGVSDFSSERMEDLAVGPGGRIFVTGSTRGGEGPPANLTVAYSAQGDELWANLAGWPPAFSGTRSLAVDERGVAYVAGQAAGSTTDELVVLSLDPSGNTLWRYAHGGGTASRASDVVVLPGGSIQVTGSAWGQGWDLLTVQLRDQTGLLIDGFESGDTSAWSATAP